MSYNDASGGAGITNLDFVLTGLDEEITMGASGELFGVAIPTMDVSATAIFNVKTSSMRDVFQFQTDASDADQIKDSTDTLYYVKMDRWPTTGILNPVHAMMDHSDSENPIATGDSNGTYVDNRMLVKHDFVRYLALKLFNTYQGVDLFSNEDAMKEDLAEKGAAAWASISGDLHTANGNNPMTNSDDTNNFSRQLLEQIINNDRDRLISDASAGTIDASNVVQAMPLVDGDTISFKITLKAATGQHNLTGVSAIGDRTYKIKLVLGSGTNTTPTDKKDASADSDYLASYYDDVNGSSVSKADARPAH
jgi:hypothetical protein